VPLCKRFHFLAKKIHRFLVSALEKQIHLLDASLIYDLQLSLLFLPFLACSFPASSHRLYMSASAGAEFLVMLRFDLEWLTAIGPCTGFEFRLIQQIGSDRHP